MVYSFKNTRLDPQDVFQEGLTRLLFNIQSGKFRGDCSLATYLNKICRNICLTYLSKPFLLSIEAISIPEKSNEEDHYYNLLEFVNKLKNHQENTCREIIDLRFRQTGESPEIQHTDNKLNSFETIAQKLDISVENARQRLKRCLDKLRQMIFAHPEYKNLFD